MAGGIHNMYKKRATDIFFLLFFEGRYAAHVTHTSSPRSNTRNLSRL